MSHHHRHHHHHHHHHHHPGMVGRALEGAAIVEAAQGNWGAAAAFATAAHFNHHRMHWSPWHRENWLVQRAIRREMIRRSMTISIAPTIPLYETVIVMNPQNQLVVLPANAGVQICTQHVLSPLPELIEVIFDQGGTRTVVYADRRCTRCNQHFFCHPTGTPPPIVIPGGPSPVYAAPSPVYAAPSPVYAAPAPVYAAPSPVYAAPAPVYAAPAPVYAAPAPVVVVQSGQRYCPGCRFVVAVGIRTCPGCRRAI